MPKFGRFLFLVSIFLLSTFVLSACSLLDWKKKSGLQVLTNEIPAEVYLDGKLLAETPYMNKELAPGEYTLEIKPVNPGLASYQTKVSLKNGLLTVVNWKMGTRPENSGGVIYEMESLKNRKKSELSLTTIPDGAIVRVDGQAQGFSPVVMENLTAGEHEYEVKLPSYETQKHTINALEGYRMLITLKLAKQEYSPLSASDSAALNTPSPTATSSVTPASNSSATERNQIASPSAGATVPKPKVTVQSTRFFVQGKEVLRVRATPGASGAELGYAPVGSEYAYLNESQSGWYKISFEGKTGWVSSQFVQLIQ